MARTTRRDIMIIENPLKANAPKDAIGVWSGLYYKIGRLNYLYFWNGEEWIKSDHDPEKIQESINKKIDPFSPNDSANKKRSAR
jgi:hypothetical protein